MSKPRFATEPKKVATREIENFDPDFDVIKYYSKPHLKKNVKRVRSNNSSNWDE